MQTIATWADAIPDGFVYFILGIPVLLLVIAVYCLCSALRRSNPQDQSSEPNSVDTPNE